MDSSIIHELWRLVESTPMRPLLNLDDTELINLITNQMQKDKGLTHDQLEQLQDYVSGRILLIRDLAWSRILA